MKILIGLDLSERYPKVYEVAKRHALSMKASVWLIHVAPPDPDFVGYRAGPQSVRDSVAEEYKEHHQQLQQLAQECRDAGLEATALLVQGPTAEMLQSEACKLGCDLMVLGSHGSGKLSHLLGGSVALAVLEKADRPVLIVPTR